MLTENDFAPLLNAVPSYAPVWDELKQGVRPELVAREFCLWLADHVAERAAKGDFSQLDWLFAAVDQMLRTANEKLSNALVEGFLEDIIHFADIHGVDLSRIAVHINGNEVRPAWEAAYAYTKGPI